MDGALEVSKGRSNHGQEFALTDRVAMVSGGNREMTIALCKAGSRAVYCIGKNDVSHLANT